jgi:hypothetical protein
LGDLFLYLFAKIVNIFLIAKHISFFNCILPTKPKFYLMNKKCIFICIALTLTILCNAQSIHKDFEDCSLTDWHQSDSNRWEVDTISPIKGDGSLHHSFNNTVVGIDMIVLPHEVLMLDSATTDWQFSIRYNYNPSSSNNWSAWLINGSGDEEVFPETESYGYVVGVNYLGSDDILKFWRKDKSGTELVFSTLFNWQQRVAAEESVEMKIERTVVGNWEIFIDTLNAGNWQLLGTFNDNCFKEIYYFGLYYKYTSTQDRKLWFDDLLINGYFFTDKVPPGIDSVEVIDKTHLNVFFNEPVDTTKNFDVSLNGKEKPAKYQWQSNRQLTLGFTCTFSVNNTLEIVKISDLKGNVAASIASNFTFYSPQKYDVNITEIFADPTPSVGLPECEYLELYNRSEHPININNWELLFNDKTIVFPDVILEPGNYYLLVKSSCADAFEGNIHKITFGSLPALINTGMLLQLVDNYGQIIHVVEYSDAWFTDELKKEGGYSLEMIDKENPCLGKSNWAASIADLGGTPGSENSVNEMETENKMPFISSWNLASNKSIHIVFSENMDSLSGADINNYFLIPQIGHPEQVFVEAPFFNKAELKFKDEFSFGTSYSLDFENSKITDCSGNQLADAKISFGLPETCDSADVIINEILFESTDPVPEFIELFNQSDKIIDLNDFHISTVDSYSREIKNSMNLAESQLFLYPRDYFVFTENKENLLLAFPSAIESKVFCPESWMTLTNEGGLLQLTSADSSIIDLAIFNTDMQFSLLSETAGISLERISAEKPGNIPQSWHSASEKSGYGTPTLPNSQNIDSVNTTNTFTIEPKEISPDNDGYDDIITIGYSFNKPGYILSATIYDLSGRRVRELTNNELCNISGSIIWDGLDKNGNRLTMGYYIIFLEAVHPTGEIERAKEAVLVLPEKK